MGAPPHQLFLRAIEAARKALHDLDADQVPAGLRRVAAHAGTLPPPLARSLLKGIDRYDWLREKAGEAWPEADAGAEGPDQASALLLLRPPGWVAEIAAIATVRGGSSARDQEADLRNRLGVAETQRDQWKRRVRDEKRAREEESQRLERRIGEERALRKALQAEPKRAEAALQADIDRLKAERDAAAGEREAASAEARSARETVAAQRKRRARAEAALAEAKAGSSWAGDPLDLAVALDDMAAMSRPDATGRGAVPASGGVRGSLRLPERMLPDSAEALEWVLQRLEPRTLLIDGYNAGFMLTGKMDPGRARRRLGMVLARLDKVAPGPLQVVVVFDSDLGGEESAAPWSGGVEERFTEEGTTADDRIVMLVESAPGVPVVVTSDRDLRERAEAVGALALWSEALVRWAERRRG